MGHRYDTFGAAYADFEDEFAAIKQNLEWAAANAAAALSGVSDPVDKTHFGYLVYAVQLIQQSFDKMGDYTESIYNHSHFYESVYWANKDQADPPEYELTLVKIIEAYIAADDDHRTGHRLLLDAYKSSMYDKPFDKEYHALWVQRFRSWT